MALQLMFTTRANVKATMMVDNAWDNVQIDVSGLLIGFNQLYFCVLMR